MVQGNVFHALNDKSACKDFARVKFGDGLSLLEVRVADFPFGLQVHYVSFFDARVVVVCVFFLKSYLREGLYHITEVALVLTSNPRVDW